MTGVQTCALPICEMRFEELQKLQQEIKQSVESAVESTQGNINQQMVEIKGAVNDAAKPKKVSSKNVSSKTSSPAKPTVATNKRAKVAVK